MARGLNKVMLIGNLGKDPEMKYTQQGTPITTFSVAVSRNRKGSDGQNKDETEWFRVVAWEKLAETCNEYLRKGSKVYIEGRLQTREYQGQDGQNRQSIEVVANEMLILDSRQQGGSPGGFNEDRQYAPKPSGGGGGSSAGFDDDADMDADDIPF
ncbi:MAG TPA: single-stranded DNA-binding protein [Chloroflexia bacterium]|nr:single-stranded DNA-binding protein [Chloroflexia bacterium]